MTIELTIAVAGILGMLIGLRINNSGIKERDKRIAELEKDLEQQVSSIKKELIVQQNVAISNNNTINRLRRENEKFKVKIEELETLKNEAK